MAKNKVLNIRIDEDVKEELNRLAKENGYTSLSDYMISSSMKGDAVKLSDGSRDKLLEKAKSHGYETLSEYLTFVGLNAEITVEVK